jgi:phage/plasmid-associated DNA primase
MLFYLSGVGLVTSEMTISVFTEVKDQILVLRLKHEDDKYTAVLYMYEEPIEVDYYGVTIDASTISNENFVESTSSQHDMQEYIALALNITTKEAADILKKFVVDIKKEQEIHAWSKERAKFENSIEADDTKDIKTILENYKKSDSKAENLKMAKHIITNHYLDAEKSIVLEVIDFDLKEHFGLNRDGTTVLKNLYKNAQDVGIRRMTEEEVKLKAEQESLREAEKEQLEEEERQADLERKKYIASLERTLRNEDGKATIPEIVAARKNLKLGMQKDFWTIEGMNPKTGAKGHLSLKKIQIAEYIYTAYNLIRYAGRNWWYDYEKGYYQYDNDDVYLQKEIIDIMKESNVDINEEHYQYNGNVEGDARNILKLAAFSKVSKDRDNPFNKHVGYINSKNGVLELDVKNRKVKIIGKKPEFKFSYCINTTYNPDADIVNDIIHMELENIVGAYQRDLLYQLCELAIVDSDPARDPSKIMYILMGKRDAGKGVVMSTINEFFGNSIVSHCKLLDLAENKFILPDLEGKLINLDDELPEQLELTESSRLKALSGGKCHRLEPKGAKAYEGILTALHVFSGNQFPKCRVSKDDTAFWDRWDIIKFPKKFPRTGDFLKGLLTEENMSSFFGHVLEKVFDLLQGKPILRNQLGYSVYTQWMASSSTVYRFMDAMTDPTEYECEYGKESLFGYYKRWCEHMGIPEKDRAQGITAFTQDLKNRCEVLVGRSGSYVKGATDDREYVYRMYREYNEYNAKQPPEQTYEIDEYGNPYLVDEDGAQRRVNECDF